MFIVEPQGSTPIVADSVEEAVKKHWESMRREPEDNTYFNVFDTSSCDFFVICHNNDFDPVDPTSKEFEKVVHFSKTERQKLIEEMVFKAHCDDTVLRQLCEMAAMQINTQDAYNDWVGEESDEAHA
jgi:hypothetical protein